MREKNFAFVWAPEDFWKLTKEQLQNLIGNGGCGAGKWGDYLVPDTIWFLKIKPACTIHDFMYYLGETLADKEKADRVFYNNMLRIVEAKTSWGWLKKLRRRRAKIYYSFVKEFGAPAYWKNKNKSTEFKEVIL